MELLAERVLISTITPSTRSFATFRAPTHRLLNSRQEVGKGSLVVNSTVPFAPRVIMVSSAPDGSFLV